MGKENRLARAVVYVKLKDGVLDPQGGISWDKGRSFR